MSVEKSLKAAEIPDEEGGEKDQRGDRFGPEPEEKEEEDLQEKKDEEEVKRDEADEEEVVEDEDEEDKEDAEEEEEGNSCFGFVLVETHLTLLLVVVVNNNIRETVFVSCDRVWFLISTDSKDKSPSGDKSEYDSSSPLSTCVFALTGSQTVSVLMVLVSIRLWDQYM